MLLYYITTVVHVFVCIILILVVLLQSGKSADLSGAFGGGATQTAFGARGPSSFLSKMTTVAAIIFMFTSVALSMMYHKTGPDSSSVMDKTKTSAKPAAKVPAKQPQTTAPTPDQIKKIQEEIEAKQKQQPAQAQSGQPQTQQKPMGMKVVVTNTRSDEPSAPSGSSGKGSQNQPAKESKPQSK
jgi:preprotein translocase subunit SecG